MTNNNISEEITIFQGRIAPEEGILVGYGALISHYKLEVPLPDKLSLISKKHTKYKTEEWNIFTPRHKPKDDIYNHLIFALKYEGIELHTLKELFKTVGKITITDIIKEKPTGQYSRRIWFLYEWLLEEKLDIPDLTKGNFIDLIDPKLQYPGPSIKFQRQKIKNNLPGVKNFCPIIRRTITLDNFINKELSKEANNSISTLQKEILLRASAFLLLKDSKASYAIEGEAPTITRAQRWGKAIGQAGKYPLSKQELLRLQQIVIKNSRFIELGWRKQGGFVGEHDRTSGTPIPDHISAKQEDIDTLITGLIDTYSKLMSDDYHAILTACLIAFGFVYIHPFIDGNGRIHRYIIHHILIKKKFTANNIIFPISSAILEHIEEYRNILEAYSLPRLDYIEWKKTEDNNITVKNDTIDLYRYFDATKQAEFLFSCVERTIKKTIPEEVKYLERYDKFKKFIDDKLEMPDRFIDLLVRFLQQGNGKLSKRSLNKEFKKLTPKEVFQIEKAYNNIFLPPTKKA